MASCHQAGRRTLAKGGLVGCNFGLILRRQFGAVQGELGKLHFGTNTQELRRACRVEARQSPGNLRLYGVQAISQGSTASADQVEDQDDQRDHQQKMNQAAGYVETETQKPQNQNDNQNCPKHIFSIASGTAASLKLPAGRSSYQLTTSKNG
jgi:hypothetical protein